MNVTFQPLSELPVKEVSELWNQSFEGYLVPAALPLDRLYKHPYQIALGMAAEAARLPLYTTGEVWQADLPSLKDGESVAVFDGGVTAGYALYRRIFSPDGFLTGIVLYRIEVAPGRTDAKDIMTAALHEVWQPGETCRRSAFNIRASNTLLVDLLSEMGLTVTMEQVLMIRKMG